MGSVQTLFKNGIPAVPPPSYGQQLNAKGLCACGRCGERLSPNTLEWEGAWYNGNAHLDQIQRQAYFERVNSQSTAQTANQAAQRQALRARREQQAAKLRDPQVQKCLLETYALDSEILTIAADRLLYGGYLKLEGGSRPSQPPSPGVIGNGRVTAKR